MGLFQDLENFVDSDAMQQKVETLFKLKNINETYFKVRKGFPDVANGVVVRCYFDVVDFCNIWPGVAREDEHFLVCLCITSAEILGMNSSNNSFVAIRDASYQPKTHEDAWAAKILTGIWNVYADVILHRNTQDRPGRYYRLVYWVENGELNRYWEED